MSGFPSNRQTGCKGRPNRLQAINCPPVHSGVQTAAQVADSDVVVAHTVDVSTAIAAHIALRLHLKEVREE